MARKRDKTEDHPAVSMGRSTIVCKCGWNVARTELCETEEEDHEVLRTLHAKHVLTSILAS